MNRHLIMEQHKAEKNETMVLLDPSITNNTDNTDNNININSNNTS